MELQVEVSLLFMNDGILLPIVSVEHMHGFGKEIRLHVCAMAYDMTVVAGTGK